MFQDQLSHLHVIVFCENNLTQLWPLSRQNAPFDLQQQAQGKSLLFQTLEAVAPLSPHPITLLAPENLSEIILDHLVSQESELFDQLEIVPQAQSASTLLSIALLAARIKLKDPQAILMLISTHQQFETGDLWASAVTRAYKAAEKDFVVLLGTQPKESVAKHPCATPIKELEDLSGVFTARQYIHRPALNFSIRMSAQKVLWCTDITLAKATTILGELNKAPNPEDASESLARMVETANFLAPLGIEAWRSPEALELLKSFPESSFAHSVLEQSDRLAIVPTSFAWRGFSDYEEAVEQGLDKQGNSLEGRGLLADAERTLVYSQTQKLTVCLGTKNLMIVDTPDALLIADRSQLDSLGEVLQILKDAEAPEL